MSLTMRNMLEAGCHFGHQTRFWNPKMAPFIYGERNRIHIIHLEKTMMMFREALQFVRRVARNHGKILFVGTKRTASALIAEEALRCQMPYVDHRWLGGMLTNFKTVRQSMKRLHDMDDEVAGGLYDRVLKKEALMHARRIRKLRCSLGGISLMNALPEAVFVVDVGHQKIAVAEANKLGIPVVGIVDTNCSPMGIDYVVPGNDDSQRAIRLYTRCVADAVLTGRSQSVQELKDALMDSGNNEKVAAPDGTGVVVEQSH